MGGGGGGGKWAKLTHHDANQPFRKTAPQKQKKDPSLASLQAGKRVKALWKLWKNVESKRSEKERVLNRTILG